MSGRAKALLGLLIARPLIAVAIAAVVVVGALLLGTHRQKTPVTHRTERVRLTDQARCCGRSVSSSREIGRAETASICRTPGYGSASLSSWA